MDQEVGEGLSFWSGTKCGVASFGRGPKSEGGKLQRSNQKVEGESFRDPTRKWGEGGGGKLSKLTKIKLRQNLKSHLGL